MVKHKHNRLILWIGRMDFYNNKNDQFQDRATTIHNHFMKWSAIWSHTENMINSKFWPRNTNAYTNTYGYLWVRYFCGHNIMICNKEIILYCFCQHYRLNTSTNVHNREMKNGFIKQIGCISFIS